LLHLGGCDFAADPSLPGDRADVVWLSCHNPRMVLLTGASPTFADTPAALALAETTRIATAPEGDYLAFAGRDGPTMLRLSIDEPPTAALLPFDVLFPERVATALRIWRAMERGQAPSVDVPTADQLRRRKLILRALDGHLAGATYREIAVGLFGSKRVPSGDGWRIHHLRSRTIRLVRDGLERMRGGYLRLLRPDRRHR